MGVEGRALIPILFPPESEVRMSRGMTKAARLEQMLWMYSQRAHSDIELAEALGVDRTTVFRDRKELMLETFLDEEAPGRYRIHPDQFISNIRVNLHEALALYLAARRASRQTRIAQPHVARGLEKLAAALRQPMTERLARSAAAVLERAAQPVLVYATEQVTKGWAERRKVEIVYHALNAVDARSWLVCPYLIEPALWSDGAYLVGPAEPAGSRARPGGGSTLMTFKLERIVSARATLQPFEIPPDFDEEALLAQVWGIWTREGELHEVRLRFRPGTAARRVQESAWHPRQNIEPLPDGGLIWSVKVAEWQEMLPWVRGWGAEVEVLAPEGLRGAVMDGARDLARVYRLHSNERGQSEEQKLLRLWGKTVRGEGDPRDFHPALFHMVDVGFVARELLASQASPRWRITLANSLGVTPDNLINWIPWIIAIHDIGKLSAAFQDSHPSQRLRLEEEGFTIGPPWSKQPFHAQISAIWIDEQVDLPDELRRCWLEAVLAHHGRFSSCEVLNYVRYLLRREPPEWKHFRSMAANLLRNVLNTQIPASFSKIPNVSAATMALSGFLVFCDWLGSNSQTFSAEPESSLDEYLVEAQERAHKVVERAGFHHPVFSSIGMEFKKLFPELTQPRPLQIAVDLIPEACLSVPCMAIVEAPTGEGKTEAALALAHRIALGTKTDELYYALPTTATANSMFERVRNHLIGHLELTSGIRLIHGQAHLVEDDLLTDFAENGSEQSLASEWFGNDRRKALLMPFGVGTVDQIELAALNVPFSHLRLMGLAGKVVVLDEVHAYDTYMITIIEQLVRWLASLGTSIILLSATLPAARRLALAKAFKPDVEEPSHQEAYPALWVIGSSGEYFDSPFPAQLERRIRLRLNDLQYSDEEAQSKARWLLEQTEAGGCACWITNTVDRAQQIFAALTELAPENTHLSLLHARFPLEQRHYLETHLLSKYGRDGDRPQRGIVVGTQVLEQSLDLDFDVLATDLAPIDLLLQRAGRMHRHERLSRPSNLLAPQLWINIPRDSAGEPILKSDEYVYDRYFLLRTLGVLTGRAYIILPKDYRTLIEAVYSDSPLDEANSLFQDWFKLSVRREHAQGEAKLRLLPEPLTDWSFVGRMSQLRFEEDETSAEWIVAQTRLGSESLTVIPVSADNGCFKIWADGEEIDLTMPAPIQLQRKMLKTGIRVSRPDLVTVLKKERNNLPLLFTKSALLKGCFPLYLKDSETVFQISHSTLIVRLDPRLGLVYVKGDPLDVNRFADAASV